MTAADWDARYRGSELVWGAAPNRWVERETADLLPGRVLDIACGEGRNSIWLARRGWQVTAVDFSGVALAKAAQLAEGRGVTGITWDAADLRGYQPPPGSFDLVLLAYIHLPPAESDALLHAAATALAPGGTLLVIGHDRDNIAHGYGGPQEPTVLYQAAEVVAALPGLIIVQAGQERRPVPADDGERTAIDTLVRAQRP